VELFKKGLWPFANCKTGFFYSDTSGTRSKRDFGSNESAFGVLWVLLHVAAMLGSAESEHPNLTNREIIFEDFQPM